MSMKGKGCNAVIYESLLTLPCLSAMIMLLLMEGSCQHFLQNFLLKFGCQM
jgi:hypothetical protein